MSWWGQSPFDEVVEKATSELLPAGQENLVLYLDISDQIRSKKVNAKDAMRSFKRRLAHKNPNVQLATLSLVDTCVKNGGDIFVKEIASREFMDELVSILKSPTGCNADVKNKLTTVIQTWGLASKNKPVISYMYDTYALLKAEGTQFPPVNENIDGILLETAAAPEWSDSDVCDRCRTPFTMTNRKHHCRRCGGTFCQQCSAKSVPLPQLGINEPVRVCDGCHIKLQLDKANIKTSSSTPIPKATTSTSVPSNTTTTTANNEDFDDDIKKAIELSLKEAEQQKNNYGSGYVAPQQQQQVQKAPEPKSDTLEDDTDLAAAIAASLRDMEISNNQSYSQQSQQQQQQYQQKQINKDELSPVEMENILLFSTLMDRVFATGGDVSNDPQINQLYTQIGALQPKLVKNLDDTIRKRNQFIEIHEKLNMAVKAYDRLLEERIANVRQQQSGGYIPEQHYQQQPLYHQQQQPMYPPVNDNYYQADTNKYYQTSAPPHDAYYASPSVPAATTTTNDPANNYYPQQQQQQQVNNQDMSHYYSAPPHYPQQQQQQPVEQKKPVEEAPLIDL